MKKIIQLEIISFLDPTIEKLYFDKVNEQTLIHLKFMGSKEIVLIVPQSLTSIIPPVQLKELLDEYDRNDSIYIIRNRNGITVENLSTILKRNDIKKSDAYQSGFLEGTTPMYDAYMRLKKSMAAALK